MSRVIVVGTDGNARALRAVERAASLARDLGARLHVVCAYGADATVAIDTGVDEVTVSVAESSAEIARSVAAEVGGDLPAVTSAGVHGRPGDVLVAEADRLGAEIVVVGNRRVQGPGRVLGSVAGAVARQASCDVYVVNTG